MAKRRRGDVGQTAEACSASTIVFADAASGYHLLKVDGYSRSVAVTKTTQINSRTFTIGGHTWSILYYPNGVRPDPADHISIFLRLHDDVTGGVKTRLKFSLLDNTGKPASFGQNQILHHFSQHDLRGYLKVIKREELEASGLINDDAFTIRFDITVLDEVRTEHAEIAAPAVLVPPSDLTRHLGGLLLAGDAADVSFSVHGEVVAAHRCVLAARSPVFKAQLLGSMKECTTPDAIPVEDMEANVFKAMLHFIYTDSLQEAVTAEEEDAAAAFFQHLLAAADRYDLPRLKLLCESKLCDHISVGTVAATLALAEQHHCHGLKKACLELLSSPGNLKGFMAADGLEQLSTSCVKELITKLVEQC